MPGSPPDALIFSPYDDGVYAPGSIVNLQGMASDMEDGSLPAQALHWYSDRNGYLGQGDALSISMLTLDWHAILLSATDNDALTGSASAEIYIGEQHSLPMMTRTHLARSADPLQPWR